MLHFNLRGPLSRLFRTEKPVVSQAARSFPSSHLISSFVMVWMAAVNLAAQSNRDWFMAGANPERSGWVDEEISGNLEPDWYRPFDAYISQKVQIVAVEGVLYLSTSKGLYAIDAASGDIRWVYPTELPLGHSPSVVDDTVYVGGFDKQIHAISASTGEALWTFAGEQGFHTNPLVVNDVILAGNRDGCFYAVDCASGSLKWEFKSGGPILYSAAFKDGVVFFASNDSHAYALHVDDGSLVWKSKKLPGAGFHSWWPVVYEDVVIFSGSRNYKDSFNATEKADVYPNYEEDPRGTFVGPLGTAPGKWADGTLTIDASHPNVTTNGSTTPITEYLEDKPWRRTYIVLDRFSGIELTYDFDGDHKPEYAPILWTGTHSGNRFPPIVGIDGVLYQQNNYMSSPSIAGGHISGWTINTPFISLPICADQQCKRGWNAVDEPVGYSGGGNLIYWNRCCDRVSGSFSITQPGLSWQFFTYNTGNGTSLSEMLPGYGAKFHNPDTGTAANSPLATFGKDGVYGWHADTNPPIPHQGRVFMHRSNTVIAFSDSAATAPRALPSAPIIEANKKDVLDSSYAQLRHLPTRQDIQQRLLSEVTRLLDSGHLRPAYISHGMFDRRSRRCGDALSDYWHNSAETIFTLTIAYPHLPLETRLRVSSYLESELAAFPPWEYNHIGWQGAHREIYETPSDAQLSSDPDSENHLFLWRKNPFTFYALWKYAETFGNARQLFEASHENLNPVPPDDELLRIPHALNAFIAGYLGYLKLEQMAGFPRSREIEDEFQRLLELRLSNFTKASSYSEEADPNLAYCRTLNVANNFMYLVPELADELRRSQLAKIKQTLEEYELLAPYWFVTNAEEAFAENAMVPIYDSWALFQARALILRDSFEELARYIDIPAVSVGDLYFVQNLVALLNSRSHRSRFGRGRRRENSDKQVFP